MQESSQPAESATGADSEDLSLVRDALRRDERALEAFAERMKCIPRLLAAQNSKLGRPLGSTEIEDVSQDTVMAVWRKLSDYDGRVRLGTWVYRFCYLEILRRLRGRRSAIRVTEPLSGGFPDREQPADPPYDEYDDLYQAMERLREDERQVLQLRHYEDLTFEELATRLQLSPNTAKTRYYRALEKLRVLLAKSTGAPHEERRH